MLKECVSIQECGGLGRGGEERRGEERSVA
jgi:hypothetical protein